MRYTRSVLVAAVATTTVLATSPAEAASPFSATPARITTALPGVDEIVRDGITLLHTRTTVGATRVTGKGATRSDFDGDGRDDIAAYSTSGVSVLYSSSPFRDLLTTELPGGSGSLGSKLATGDFNGDGYDDLAVSDYAEADLRRLGYTAGAVWVIPGSASGLRPSAVRHFNQSTAGVPGTSERGDWFGMSLAAGDITGDGRDDLAVGIPYKRVAGKRAAGAVVVLKGSPSGVVGTGAQWLSQASKGVPGSPETDDHFGSGVAIGRIDKNRYAELVVGAPQEDDGKAWEGSGVVTQFWGTSRGVSLAKVTAVTGTQVTHAVKQTGTYLWYLGGSSMAIGDTTGDGYGEVIIGASGAEVDWEIYPGAVVSLAGRKTGLSAKGAIVLHQDSKGVAGATESDDRFGDVVAVGDVTGDGRADVLVGVPQEGFGKAKNAGSVVLLRGAAKGLTGVGSQSITQSAAGVPDSLERDDQFGAAVAIRNLNGSGGLDALIGSPNEQIAGDTPGYASGSVTWLYGGSKGLGSGSAINGRTLGLGLAATFGQHLPW